jgi:prepilin-type N-terminal cleavage/methylation domain-containing protein
MIPTIPATGPAAFKAPATSAAARSRGGFTLVEVLVTVAVIAFGCLAALLMQSAALRGNTMADNMTVATFIAESEMERLKALSFEDVGNEIDTEGTTRTWYTDRLYKVCPAASAADCQQQFPFEVTLSFYPRYPTSKSHLAEVLVSWKDNTGMHSVHNASTMTDLSF